MNELGVIAEIVWARVTENSSVMSTIKKKYPARSGAGLKPGGK